MRKLDRRHQIHYRMNEQKFKQQIRNAILKCSNEKKSISMEELERWIEEDKKRRKLKNRIKRMVSAIAEKIRLR